MTLIEILIQLVGPSVARLILSRWLQSEYISDISHPLIEIIKEKTHDIAAQGEVNRLFEKIGKDAAESLEPLFSEVSENSRQAVAFAVAETFKQVPVDAKVLASHDLDPQKLATLFFDGYPKAVGSFSDTETELYRRIILEASENIIDIASELTGFQERTLSEILKREDLLLARINLLIEEYKKDRLGKQEQPQSKTGNFPIDMSPGIYQEFIGREDEIQSAKKYILLGNPNVLFVSGMPGVGKTLFVNFICQEKEIRKKYSEGVLWLNLDEQSDFETLSALIAEALRIEFSSPPSFRERVDSIKDSLRTKKIIIVLDNANFRQVDLLQALMLGGEDCYHLVTTRDHDLAFENSSIMELFNLSLVSSIKLIKKVSKWEGVSEESLGLIAQQLGYNPLALNIASQLISAEIMSGHSIKSILNDLLNLNMVLDEPIYKKVPGIPEGEATLEKVIGLSYKRLSDKDKKAFRQMGILIYAVAGFTDNYLRFIWRADSFVTKRIRRRLFNSGLMIYEKDLYRLHPLIANIAFRYLSDDDAEMLDAFLQYTICIVENITARSNEEKSIISLLDHNTQNSLALFSLLNQEYQNANVESNAPDGLKDVIDVLGIINAKVMGDLLSKAGLWKALKDWNDIAIAASRKLGLWVNEYKALMSEANRLSAFENSELAFEYAERAMQLAQEHQDANGIARSYAEISSVYARKPDVQNALAYAQKAESLISEDISADVRFLTFTSLGDAYRMSGDPQKAIEYFEQALEAKGGELDDNKKSLLMNLLGMTYGDLGRWEKAIEYYQIGLEDALQRNNMHFAMKNKLDLGYAYHQARKYSEALPILTDVVQYLETTEDKHIICTAKNNLGLVYRDLKKYDKALNIFRQCRQDSIKYNDTMNLAHSLNNIGTIYSAQKKYKLALLQLQKAEKIYREIGIVIPLPHNLITQGGVHLVASVNMSKKLKVTSLKKANQITEQAFRLAHQIGSLNYEIEAVEQLIYINLYSEKIQEAISLVAYLEKKVQENGVQNSNIQSIKEIIELAKSKFGYR